jgi:hypothetical protein
LRTWFIACLGQSRVDDFCGYGASLLQAHDDIAWFDVPLKELLLVNPQLNLRSAISSGSFTLSRPKR